MSLIHPTILYGLGLGLIPILLHFLMRPRPRKLIFPALRLIQVHRKTNKQRMRLRHIWLLLLRIAVIGLLVIAVARPRFPPANYALILRETVTLLAILGVAAVAYWGVLSFWRKKRLPNHALSYRRSMLRGGTSIVAILLLLLLVAWPYQRRVAAEIAAPLPERALDLPVSAVFLFDSSLSMQYRLESKTRLEVAQQIASEQISSVPVGSRVAVADTSSDNPLLFQADLTVAQARVDALEIRPVGIPLNDRLRAALQLQEEDSERIRGAASGIPEEKQSDRYLREIFLFTDMARSGWRSSASSLLREELKRLSFVSVYLIDVGVEDPMNVGITSLSLSQQTLTTGR